MVNGYKVLFAYFFFQEMHICQITYTIANISFGLKFFLLAFSFKKCTFAKSLTP